jgi:hypothetical protein
MAEEARLIEAGFEDGVLVVRLRGAPTARGVRPEVTHVVELAISRGQRGVLIDLTALDAPVDSVERLHLGTAVADRWPSSLRMALLQPREHEYFGRLFLNAMSRKGIEAQEFVDRASAVSWLGEDRPTGAAAESGRQKPAGLQSRDRR